MIIVDAVGQMANQMFQYAFALATARNLRTRFYLRNRHPYRFTLDSYFEVPAYSSLGNRILSRSCFVSKQVEKRLPCMYFNDKLPPEENMLKIRNNVICHGFYQSETYFRAHSREIRAHFKIKGQFRERFQDQYSNVFGSHRTIVMHFRRTDYETCALNRPEIGNASIILPMDYYEKALASINNLEDYKIFAVSDAPDDIRDDVRMYWGDIPQISVTSNDAITDFQLIQNADIAVIANSSFSWWAAYLNQNLRKRVIAPKYWLGFRVQSEYPKGIMDIAWDWIDFEI